MTLNVEDVGDTGGVGVGEEGGELVVAERVWERERNIVVILREMVDGSWWWKKR